MQKWPPCTRAAVRSATATEPVGGRGVERGLWRGERRRCQLCTTWQQRAPPIRSFLLVAGCHRRFIFSERLVQRVVLLSRWRRLASACVLYLKLVQCTPIIKF